MRTSYQRAALYIVTNGVVKPGTKRARRILGSVGMRRIEEEGLAAVLIEHTFSSTEETLADIAGRMWLLPGETIALDAIPGIIIRPAAFEKLDDDQWQILLDALAIARLPDHVLPGARGRRNIDALHSASAREFTSAVASRIKYGIEPWGQFYHYVAMALAPHVSEAQMEAAIAEALNDTEHQETGIRAEAEKRP